MFFTENNYSPTKRCYPCRAKKRALRDAEVGQTQVNQSFDYAPKFQELPPTGGKPRNKNGMRGRRGQEDDY